MTATSAATVDRVETPSLEQLTALLRLLSDPTRLHLLMLLAAGERNVTSLCDQTRLPQPTISHHLGLLRMSSLVSNRRSGKQVFYALGSRVHQLPDGELRLNGETFCVKIGPRQ